MSRKKRRRPKTSSPPQRPRPRIRWLILIDNEPIRREALAVYRELESQGARLRAEIERFEAIDRPAYERWEAATFGPLLTELREVSAALGQKQRLLDAITEEIVWSGCSRLTAYRHVMQRVSEPPSAADEEPDFPPDAEEGDEPDEPDFAGEARLFGKRDLPPGFSARDFDRMSPAEKREFREFFGAIAALHELMTGQPAPNLDETLARDRAQRGGGAQAQTRHAGPRAPAAEINRGEARLKELYRKIVRQLHPDANGEFTPRERELWHEAQEAYRGRDLDRLEAVAARIELTDAVASAQTPVGVLLRIARDLRVALESVRRQLGQVKKQPAWRFPEKTREWPSLEARRRRQVEQALRENRVALAEATAILDDLARRAARPRKKRSKRASVRAVPSGTQMEFL